MKIHENNEKIVIDCETKLDSRSCFDYKTLLLSAIEMNKSIEIHTNDVIDADTASIQLLTCFYCSCKNKKIMCQWGKPSNAFLNRVTLLGLRKIVELAE
jgi:hypothetical protein